VILLVTHSADLGADLVIRCLRDLDAPYRRLDTDRLGTPDCRMECAGQELELHERGRVLAARDVRAVWHRRLARPLVLDDVAPHLRDFAERELGYVLDAFFDTIPGLHVNPFEADRTAGNRLVQARRAQAVGFGVPDTLATQSEARARDFISRHVSVVTKAISFGLLDEHANTAAYTSPVGEGMDWTGLRACPCLLQRRVPKRHEWRVTTVGDRAFAARTRSGVPVDQDDWRLSANAADIFEAAVLPPAIERMLLRLCEISRLAFGAHDMIESSSGDFYFLETNPSGQWGWLELSLGLPIAMALAELLIGAERMQP
jgi:hypothetical protein